MLALLALLLLCLLSGLGLFLGHIADGLGFFAVGVTLIRDNGILGTRKERTIRLVVPPVGASQGEPRGRHGSGIGGGD